MKHIRLPYFEYESHVFHDTGHLYLLLQKTLSLTVLIFLGTSI